jgi:hypothetical protein
MIWPWPLPTRGEIAAVLVILAIGGALIFAFIKYPYGAANRGFGPEWDCTQPGSGDPVCLKRAPATPSNSN